MCNKRETCPLYTERKVNGILNACGNCEYVKQIERRSFYYKVGLGIAMIVFLTATYSIY